MLRHKNIAKRIETRLKYGWMKIYVTRTVSRWLSKPHRNNGLAVVCKTCQRQNHKTIYGYKEGMMPILVFYMHQNKGHGRRYKRETDCIGGNCCRRETLEINFQDIGWDYIMAPPSIRPNFCTGSCNGMVYMFSDDFQYILQFLFCLFLSCLCFLIRVPRIKNHKNKRKAGDTKSP